MPPFVANNNSSQPNTVSSDFSQYRLDLQTMFAENAMPQAPVDSVVSGGDVFEAAHNVIAGVVARVGSFPPTAWQEWANNRQLSKEFLFGLFHRSLQPAPSDASLALSASLFAETANMTGFFHPEDYFEAARLYHLARSYFNAGLSYYAAAENAAQIIGPALQAAVYEEASREFLLAGDLPHADYMLLLRVELAARIGNGDKKIVYLRELAAHFDRTGRHLFAEQVGVEVAREQQTQRTINTYLAQAETARMSGHIFSEFKALVNASCAQLKNGSVDDAKKTFQKALQAAEGGGLYGEAADASVVFAQEVGKTSGDVEVWKYYFRAAIDYKLAAENEDGRVLNGAASFTGRDYFYHRSSLALREAMLLRFSFALLPNSGATALAQIIKMINDTGVVGSSFYEDMRSAMWLTLSTPRFFNRADRAGKLAATQAYMAVAEAIAKKFAESGDIKQAIGFMIDAYGDIRSAFSIWGDSGAIARDAVLRFYGRIDRAQRSKIGLGNRVRLWFFERFTRVASEEKPQDVQANVYYGGESKITEPQFFEGQTSERPSLEQICKKIAAEEASGDYLKAEISRLNVLGPALEAAGLANEAADLYAELAQSFAIENQNDSQSTRANKEALHALALCRRGRILAANASNSADDVVSGGSMLRVGAAAYVELLMSQVVSDGGASQLVIDGMTELFNANEPDLALSLLKHIYKKNTVNPSAIERVFRLAVLPRYGNDRRVVLEFLTLARPILVSSQGEVSASLVIDGLAKESSALFLGDVLSVGGVRPVMASTNSSLAGATLSVPNLADAYVKPKGKNKKTTGMLPNMTTPKQSEKKPALSSDLGESVEIAKTPRGRGRLGRALRTINNRK